MQWKCFGGVCKRDGSFAGGVHGHEDVDCCGDAAEALGCGRYAVGLEGEVEGHAAPEQADAHEGECGEEEVSTAEGVDGVDCGDGEEEIGYAGAHARQKGFGFGEAGLAEDGGGVVCDDLVIYLVSNSKDRFAKVKDSRLRRRIAA